MSMQKKLDKAFEQGVHAAYDVFDKFLQDVPGIGPKTMDKLKKAIEEKATEYKAKGAKGA